MGAADSSLLCGPCQAPSEGAEELFDYEHGAGAREAEVRQDMTSHGDKLEVGVNPMNDRGRHVTEKEVIGMEDRFFPFEEDSNESVMTGVSPTKERQVNAAADLTSLVHLGPTELDNALRQRGISPSQLNWRNGNYSLLHVAVLEGRPDIVDYALGSGVDARAKDQLGRTALQLAYQVSAWAVVERLVQHLEALPASPESPLATTSRASSYWPPLTPAPSPDDFSSLSESFSYSFNADSPTKALEAFPSETAPMDLPCRPGLPRAADPVTTSASRRRRGIARLLAKTASRLRRLTLHSLGAEPPLPPAPKPAPST